MSHPNDFPPDWTMPEGAPRIALDLDLSQLAKLPVGDNEPDREARRSVLRAVYDWPHSSPAELAERFDLREEDVDACAEACVRLGLMHRIGARFSKAERLDLTRTGWASLGGWAMRRAAERAEREEAAERERLAKPRDGAGGAA